MKKVFVTVLFLLVSQLSFAAGRAPGFEVEFVRVDRSGKGFVKFTQPLIGDPPDCGESHPNHLSFDTADGKGGKGILSIVLTAYSTGKRINAWGTGNCGDYGVVEEWSHGWILD